MKRVVSVSKINKMSLKKIFFILILCVGVLFVFYLLDSDNEYLAYRNSVNEVPSNYNGPIFELQHNYPKELPTGSAKEKLSWLQEKVSFDRPKNNEGKFTPEWDRYIDGVKTYLKNNIKLTDTGYFLIKPWYNLPWLAADPYYGREFTHGARYSFSIPIQQIVPSCDSNILVPVWGIANYNEYGGYAIGQMWSSGGELNYKPGSNNNELMGLPFPEGTVIHKLNMIGHLGEYQAIHLKDAPTWNLNLHTTDPSSTFKGPSARSIKKAHIFEMDFMVKDSRSPTGWVFGAFVYDEKVNKNSDIWDRYTIMGIQFGNDPNSFPSVAQDSSKTIYQTLLKPISDNWTVGCNNRLATFQGTPNQNCIGCHQTASFVSGTSKDAARGYNLTYSIKCYDSSTTIDNFYFQNWKYPDTFSGSTKYPKDSIVGTDFSLRVYDVVKSYRKYRK